MQQTGNHMRGAEDLKDSGVDCDVTAAGMGSITPLNWREGMHVDRRD